MMTIRFRCRLYPGPFALPRPGLFEESMCESFRIKAVACRKNYSDSDVVSRSFALVIYEKDKKRLLWEGYYLDDDLVYNLWPSGFFDSAFLCCHCVGITHVCTDKITT